MIRWPVKLSLVLDMTGLKKDLMELPAVCWLRFPNNLVILPLGVDQALESKAGEMTEEEIEAIGAGDQGMMFGYACDETPMLMPTPIYLAHKLSRRLAEVRKDGTLDWVRPDGKSQVTIEYQYGKPVRVDTALISTQHAPDISQEEIREAIIKHVIEPVLPETWWMTS